MKVLPVIFRYEWLALLRNRVYLFALCLFMVLCGYAVHYGQQEVRRQQQVTSLIRQKEKAVHLAYAAGLEADTTTPRGMTAWSRAAYPSMVRFHLRYYATDAPGELAAWSLGQRDVNRYYMGLNAQDLYQELFKSEITNPAKLLAGNFDLAFVYTYLLPLLIIAVTFSVLSGDRELGTYALLNISHTGIRRLTLYRMLFHYTVIAVLLTIVTTAALYVQAAPAGIPAAFFLLATLVYAACWCGLVFLVNALQRPADFNAMVLLGSWLLLLIIVPAMINRFVENREPVDATVMSTVIRRKTMENSDTAFANALQQFYRVAPAYKPVRDTGKTPFFAFKGYSAFLYLQEQQARQQADAYYQSVDNRYRLLQRFNVVNPAVALQTIYNRIAATDMDHAAGFRQSVYRFYHKIWLFCNDPLFHDRMLTVADYRQLPVYQQPPAVLPVRDILYGILLLALGGAVCWSAGYYLLAPARMLRRRSFKY